MFLAPAATLGKPTAASPTPQPKQRGALCTMILREGRCQMKTSQPKGLSLPKPPDHSSPKTLRGARASWGPCDGVCIYSALKKEQLILQLLKKTPPSKIKRNETHHHKLGEVVHRFKAPGRRRTCYHWPRACSAGGWKPPRHHAEQWQRWQDLSLFPLACTWRPVT